MELGTEEVIPKADDVVFRTFHGLLRETDEGLPAAPPESGSQRRNRVGHCTEKEYGLCMIAARAHVAAVKGDMAAFGRFTPRLSGTDIASIAQQAIENNWTDVFDHLVTTGVLKSSIKTR